MKKSLLFTAAALLAFGSISAEKVWKQTTIFSYGVENGVANPVPGLDGGWSGWNDGNATTQAPKSTCSRFGTGLDGKFLTTDHMNNAIIAIDGNGVTTYAELPARGEVNGTMLWNGTAIQRDDAGNVVYNYCFTNGPKSAQYWGVIDKNKNITNVVLSTPLAELGIPNNRLDQIGQIIGDVNSAEGGIAYATFKNSPNVVMLHFKGDGTKCTSLTGTKCSTPISAITKGFDGGQLLMAVPRVNTVAEVLNSTSPEPASLFYLTLGINKNTADGAPSFGEGWVGKFVPGWSPAAPAIGNRGTGGIATFELEGTRYIVRNYVTEEFEHKYPNPGYGTDPKVTEEWLYSHWKNVQNFGIFEAETGKCVASWMGSEYANGFGMGTLTAEVKDGAVYIYTWEATGSAELTSKTDPGIYCSLVKFTLEEGGEQGEISGKGTEDDPYLISSKEDLMNAYKLIPQNVASDMVYFKQTADIDMAGVENYMALNGWGGAYEGKFTYDGDYHIIKNFSPKDQEEIDNVGGYYCQSVFGVLRGKVMNLGIVDCNLDGANFGVGIVAAYCGTNNVEGSIDNVFVTGKLTNGSKYSGGFFGTGALPMTISNSYAVVEVNDSKYAGGVVGRASADLNISNSYVKATVTGAGVNGLVAGSNAAITVKGTKFVAVGSGDLVDGGAKISGCKQVAEIDAQTLAMIQGFDAFNAKKMLNGYPTLNWVELPEEPGDGTEAHPYLIATAEDLCNAYQKVDENPNGITYFKQTADIDMAGIKDYVAINGNKGGFSVDGTYKYTSAISYDGNNHIIKNFAPTFAAHENTNGKATYYRQSVFGVLVGSVKNLGIVDCNITGNTAGIGALAAYAGHGDGVVTKTASVDNVFVTGNIHGTGYAGGFFGTSGGDITIKNSYAVVDVKGNRAGGLVGRLRNTTEVAESYVASTVAGTEAQGLIAATDRTPAVTVSKVITIGSGDAFSSGITVTGNPNVTDTMSEAAKQRIQALTAFNEKKEVKGYPTLNWMNAEQIEAAGVEDVIVDNDENAPVEYYNLQGVRIENPAKGGFYIKRQGNTATKVIIR